MARIELRLREADGGRLPMVCMVCGEPAVEEVRRRFAWHPGWVILLLPLGVLPYAVIAMALTKHVRADVPMCGRHRGYWTKRFLIFVGSFVALLAVIGGVLGGAF